MAQALQGSSFALPAVAHHAAALSQVCRRPITLNTHAHAIRNVIETVRIGLHRTFLPDLLLTHHPHHLN